MKIRNPFKRDTEKKPASAPVDTPPTCSTAARTDQPSTPSAAPGAQERLRPITKTDRPRSEQAGKYASPAKPQARRSSSSTTGYTWSGSFGAGDSSGTSSSCDGGSSSSSSSSSSCGGGGGGE